MHYRFLWINSQSICQGYDLIGASVTDINGASFPRMFISCLYHRCRDAEKWLNHAASQKCRKFKSLYPPSHTSLGNVEFPGFF